MRKGAQVRKSERPRRTLGTAQVGLAREGERRDRQEMTTAIKPCVEETEDSP